MLLLMLNAVDVGACLTAGYGMRPPRLIVMLAELAYKFATREGFLNDSDYVCFADVMFDFYGHMNRPVTPTAEHFSYHCTPPEMAVVGGPGVSGIHYGFVVHAPELAATDYPFCAVNPSSDDGLKQLGVSTRAGLSVLVANAKKRDDPDLSRIEEISKHLDLEMMDGEDCVYDPQWPSIEVDVPSGWSYLPSADGVGVLAPSHLFDPSVDSGPASYGYRRDHIADAHAAQRALMRGFPATSLILARNILKFSINDPSVALRLMINAYRALNRKKQAETLLIQADRHHPTWRNVSDL